MEYAELMDLAERLGLQSHPEQNYVLADDYTFLPYLAQGENRYAYNILSGSYRQSEVLIFDYHYELPAKDPKSEDQKTHCYLTPILALVPAYFPELRLSPEGTLAKITEAFGGQDIQFESAEFSAAFRVRCLDRKFAYDVCNPKMMEYLLANRDLDILITRCVLALVSGTQPSANQIESNLQRLVEIRSRLPEYLFTKA